MFPQNCLVGLQSLSWKIIFTNLTNFKKFQKIKTSNSSNINGFLVSGSLVCIEFKNNFHNFYKSNKLFISASIVCIELENNFFKSITRFLYYSVSVDFNDPPLVLL